MHAQVARFPGAMSRAVGGLRPGSLRVGVLLAAALALGVGVGAGPADPLFRLVPPDASVILTVENLRARAQEIEASSLGHGLKQLPLVTSWLGSSRFDRYRRSARVMESGLGWSFRTVLDEVIGDAFILVLEVGPDNQVDQSSGLVLVRPRQVKILEQVIATRNAAQTRWRGLLPVIRKQHGAVTYYSRQFKPGSGRPDDHYVLFDDGTLAWSNLEETIREVIDRRAGTRAGWDTSPHFSRLRLGLPAGALASLFVGPRVVNQVLTTLVPAQSMVQRYFNIMASSYFQAVQATGFALEWRDGLRLHSHEIVDPARLAPWMASWLTRPATTSPLLGMVPASAFGMVSARFDFAAALRAIRTQVTADDRLAWESAEQAAQGMALGQPLDALLSGVEPHVLLTLGPRSGDNSSAWFGVLGAMTWVEAARPQTPWVAVDNAFRTAMAVYACRPLRQAPFFQVETQAINGRRVTRLGVADRTVLAFQAESDRLLISNNVGTIGQVTTTTGSPPASSLTEMRAKYAGAAETFALVDLPGLIEAVTRSRPAIVRDLAGRSGRPVAEVDRDLGQFLPLASLFRAAVFTSTANRDATEVHRTLGLIAR